MEQMLSLRGYKGLQFCVWKNWGKIRCANEKICKVVKKSQYFTNLPLYLRKNDIKWLEFLPRYF